MNANVQSLLDQLTKRGGSITLQRTDAISDLSVTKGAMETVLPFLDAIACENVKSFWQHLFHSCTPTIQSTKRITCANIIDAALIVSSCAKLLQCHQKSNGDSFTPSSHNLPTEKEQKHGTAKGGRKPVKNNEVLPGKDQIAGLTKLSTPTNRVDRELWTGSNDEYSGSKTPPLGVADEELISSPHRDEAPSRPSRQQSSTMKSFSTAKPSLLSESHASSLLSEESNLETLLAQTTTEESRQEEREEIWSEIPKGDFSRLSVTERREIKRHLREIEMRKQAERALNATIDSERWKHAYAEFYEDGGAPILKDQLTEARTKGYFDGGHSTGSNRSFRSLEIYKAVGMATRRLKNGDLRTSSIHPVTSRLSPMKKQGAEQLEEHLKEKRAHREFRRENAVNGGWRTSSSQLADALLRRLAATVYEGEPENEHQRSYGHCSSRDSTSMDNLLRKAKASLSAANLSSTWGSSATKKLYEDEDDGDVYARYN